MGRAGAFVQSRRNPSSCCSDDVVKDVRHDTVTIRARFQRSAWRCGQGRREECVLGEMFRAFKPKRVGVLDGFATTADAYRRLLVQKAWRTRSGTIFESV